MSNSLLYRAFIALDVFSGIASIPHLLLISLERLYAIGWPVRHRVSSRRSYLLSASMAWCITLGAAAMFVPGKSITHFPRFLVLQLCFFIPLTLICITYIMMGIIVKCHAHDANSWNHHDRPSQGNETYSDNLLLNNSLRCCMGPIHGRKYRHVFLREMFHT